MNTVASHTRIEISPVKTSKPGGNAAKTNHIGDWLAIPAVNFSYPSFERLEREFPFASSVNVGRSHSMNESRSAGTLEEFIRKERGIESDFNLRVRAHVFMPWMTSSRLVSNHNRVRRTSGSRLLRGMGLLGSLTGMRSDLPLE